MGTTLLAASLLVLVSPPLFAASAAKLNDREVMAVILAANTAGVDAAKIAQSKSTQPEVRRFAEQMGSDHGNSNRQAADISKGLELRPQESETSRAMKTSAAETIKKLNSLSGAKFDREYLNNEVAFHQTVLNTIDLALLPNVKEGKIKVLLEEIRPTVANHLEHARQLQSSLIDAGLSPDGR